MTRPTDAQSAGHPTYQALTQAQVERIERGAWYHSIELGDGAVISGVIGVEPLRARMEAFGISENLAGKRVLDVGAATGWCSFEAERRGAGVVAVDCVDFEDFHTAKQLLHSKVEYRILDVDELTPDTLGVFDYVFFFGVLYHLRHPLLGLERICALTRDAAYVESFVCDGHNTPDERAANGCYMEFYETGELGGQIDNWVGPTTNCLMALCRSAGFARVGLTHVLDRRAGVVCHRRWEAPPLAPPQPAPWLNSAVNNRTNDILFHPGKDEYICAYFNSPERGLACDSLRIEIDGLGAPVLHVAELGRDRWQANLRVPPGLAPGPHYVRLRTAQSGFSEAFPILFGGAPAPQPAAALPPDAAPELLEVENGMTQTAEFRGYRNEYLSCRFRLPAPDLDRGDAVIEVGGRECAVDFVTNLGALWQTNSKLPPDLPPGRYQVRVKLRNGQTSSALEILIAKDSTA
jgi:tRNA (mo5U34)-methyltransferase